MYDYLGFEPLTLKGRRSVVQSPGMQSSRRTLMFTLGGRRTSTLRGRWGEHQHEGNKLLTAGYCFCLLNSLLHVPLPLYHLCHPPLLFLSLPSTGPKTRKRKGRKLSARMQPVCLPKNNPSAFLLFLAAADRLEAAFQEKEQRTPRPHPTLWVFSIPPSICLHIPHFPSFAFTGDFLQPFPLLFPPHFLFSSLHRLTEPLRSSQSEMWTETHEHWQNIIGL